MQILLFYQTTDGVTDAIYISIHVIIQNCIGSTIIYTYNTRIILARLMCIGVVLYICYDSRQSKNICYLFCELLNVKKWIYFVTLPFNVIDIVH